MRHDLRYLEHATIVTAQALLILVTIALGLVLVALLAPRYGGYCISSGPRLLSAILS